jgi:predicted ATPase
MLDALHVQNLTVFPKVDLQFAPHLNVIVGENGLGKSHLLKAIYCGLHLMSPSKAGEHGTPVRTALQVPMADKLRGVFMPDTLGRIARRNRGTGGKSTCKLSFRFHGQTDPLDVSFHTASTSETKILGVPKAWLDRRPVFLPTRELLSIYPGFVSLYEDHQVPFEETWRDACLLLGRPLAKGPRLAAVRTLLEPLESTMGGSIELDGDRFYLKTERGRIEMHLVAEGMRKLAMIARLVATGALLDKGTLLWDEPEANLNPRVIKQVAQSIIDLARQGIQMFVATHSLFLLRELYILMARESTMRARYFGLHEGKGDGVTVAQGDAIEDIGDCALVDEELIQCDRYMDLANGLTPHDDKPADEA